MESIKTKPETKTEIGFILCVYAYEECVELCDEEQIRQFFFSLHTRGYHQHRIQQKTVLFLLVFTSTSLPFLYWYLALKDLTLKATLIAIQSGDQGKNGDFRMNLSKMCFFCSSIWLRNAGPKVINDTFVSNREKCRNRPVCNVYTTVNHFH